MSSPILSGAEPFSAPGGPNGVLVVHGYTGTPGSLRHLAGRFAGSGYAVEMPLLPGHGTAVADLIPVRVDDWRSAVESTYRDLAARSAKVIVVALSMGGYLATWLCRQHPEIAGLVVINPLIEPPADSFLEVMRGVLATGAASIPAVGSDIADPSSHELSYDETPIEPLLSLFAAMQELEPELGQIRCPALIFTSRQDHVVPPRSSEVLAAGLGGPVEHIWLERSYHVATQDYDAPEIEARSLEWAAKVFAADQ
jgi:carboxylesterase